MNGPNPIDAINNIDEVAKAAVEATLTGHPTPLKPRHAPERPDNKPDLRSDREVYSTASDALARQLEAGIKERSVLRDELQKQLRVIEAKITDLDVADAMAMVAMDAGARK